MSPALSVQSRALPVRPLPVSSLPSPFVAVIGLILCCVSSLFDTFEPNVKGLHFTFDYLEVQSLLKRVIGNSLDVIGTGAVVKPFRCSPNAAADGKRCNDCLLYTSDAADERSSVDLGG